MAGWYKDRRNGNLSLYIIFKRLLNFVAARKLFNSEELLILPRPQWDEWVSVWGKRRLEGDDKISNKNKIDSEEKRFFFSSRPVCTWIHMPKKRFFMGKRWPTVIIICLCYTQVVIGSYNAAIMIVVIEETAAHLAFFLVFFLYFTFIRFSDILW